MADTKKCDIDSEGHTPIPVPDSAPVAKRRREASRKSVFVVNPGMTHEYISFAQNTVDATLRTLQKAVGGDIKLIPMGPHVMEGVWAYANGDGRNLRLPDNIMGSMLLESVGFEVHCTLAGPIVFVGEDDKPLSKGQIARLAELLRQVNKELDGEDDT